MPPRRAAPQGSDPPRSPAPTTARPPATSPAEHATPTSAQFAAATTNEEASKVPPLPRDGLFDLVDRFAAIQVGAHAMLPTRDHLGHFDADDFRARAYSNLEQHELAKDKEQQQGLNQTVVISRPAFDHVAFFADLTIGGLEETTQTGKLTLFSVPSKAMATQMAARGYTKVCCTHIGEDTLLPPRIKAASADDGAAGASRRRSLAPPGVCVPPLGFTDAKCGDEDESTGEQVVREWELHVLADDKYYSPAYMWSLKLRQSAGIHPCHQLLHPCYLFLVNTHVRFTDTHVALPLHTPMSRPLTPMLHSPSIHPCHVH